MAGNKINRSNNKVLTESQKMAKREKRKLQKLKRKQRDNIRVPFASNNRALPVLSGPRIRDDGDGIRINYSEHWTPVNKGVITKIFNPGNSGIPKLDSLAKAWQRYQILALTIRYVTKASVNTAGRVIMGVDFDAQAGPTTETDVYALDPRCQGPVWENLRMVIPASKAMSKKIMRCATSDPDNYGFLLAVFADADTVGDILVDYHVRFDSPVSGPDAEPSVLAQITATNETTHGQVVGNITAESSHDSVVDVEAGITGTSDLKTETVITQGQLGDKQVVSVVGPIASNGTLKIGFKDQSSGLDLVAQGYVVQQATLAGNGFFSAIWSWVKPWLRPIVLTAVDTLLSGNGTPTTQQNFIAVTDEVPSYVAYPEIANAVGSTASGAWVGGKASFDSGVADDAVLYSDVRTDGDVVYMDIKSKVSMTNVVLAVRFTGVQQSGAADATVATSGEGGVKIDSWIADWAVPIKASSANTINGSVRVQTWPVDGILRTTVTFTNDGNRDAAKMSFAVAVIGTYSTEKAPAVLSSNGLIGDGNGLWFAASQPLQGGLNSIEARN